MTATVPSPPPHLVRAPRGWWLAAAAMFSSGWGANQFTPMLVVYRARAGLSTLEVDAMFGAYVVGLVPGLLLGGPAADRHGRRRVVLPVTALAALASMVLAAGTVAPTALYLGRLLSGVAAGAALAAATAWVKELSCPPYDAAGAASGARRAALATTAGFGVGALVAGLLAQLAPWPTVLPYVAHLVVALPLLVALRGVPETRQHTSRGRMLRHLLRGVRVPAAGDRRFRTVVAPMAPWVFGAAGLAYAILPGLVALSVPRWPVAYTALVTALTLLVGFAVQPVARRLYRPGEIRTVVLALLVTAVGLVPAALAAAWHSPLLVLPAAALLGAGYGLGLVSGLLEVQQLAGEESLAALTGVYYALTYLGFLLPATLAGVDAWLGVGYPLMFGVLGLLALGTAVVASVASHRHPTAVT